MTVGDDLIRVEDHREMQVIARLDQTLGQAARELVGVDRRSLNPPIQLGRDGGDPILEDVVSLQRRLQASNDLSLRPLIQTLGVRPLGESRSRRQNGDRHQGDEGPRKHRRSYLYKILRNMLYK